jgi:hypothetical protein
MTRWRSDGPNVANTPKPQHHGLFHKETTALITDLDGCLINTWEMLQIYIWDSHGVWVDLEENRQFNVGKGIFHLLKDHGFENPDELNTSLWAGLWSVGLWYQQARPNYRYWQALLDWRRHATEPLRYLTARPRRLVDTTLGWLHRWGLRTSLPDLVLEGSSDDKLRHIRHWAATKEVVYVDDKVSTILDIARAKLGSNVKLILFAQPWNAADSPDWRTDGFVMEGRPAHEHPEFDLFLHHGFDLGFRRLTEAQIAEAIREGLE